MTFATRPTVLIAHAEPLIQIGLEGALSSCSDMDVRSMRDSYFRLLSFDVVVTDLDSGMELARNRTGNSGGIFILTSDESEVGIRKAMEAGVRGYLLQISTLESVVQAIRRVAQGGSVIDPRALSKIIDSLSGNQLTHREIDVLRLLIQGRSDKAVARELGIALGTVKCHVKHLFSKLHARSRTEAASIAQRRGLVPPTPHHDLPPGATGIARQAVMAYLPSMPQN
jgi:DNA-binding NarL/FixJ family response regulator